MHATSDDPGRRRRVPALAPQERRTALIEATVPLLQEFGLLVTTRQIADAAGVAEGTIFGVFPDKPSLIRAAVLSVLDPEPTVRALSAIDPQDTLRERLGDVARIMQRRFSESGKLLGLVRSTAKVDDDPSELHRTLGEARCRTIEAVARVMAPDRERLRLPPAQAARLFVNLMFASSRHGFGAPDEETLGSTELVALLLDGLLVRGPEAGRSGAGQPEAARPDASGSRTGESSPRPSRPTGEPV
jgi:AcrR family transcriptional regulator